MYSSILKKYKILNFDGVIGQKYTISFLKNSLFKNIFYPLYLFSGMRGTGKTTCARLFALMSLCEKLPAFQKNVDTSLPCYNCNSCIAYTKHSHPDIIELDAASHTGVETIRSIIDNAYVLPVLSKKKFYIIDEVHMLSKAAFNACLKIMEEPPINVHFILATTEYHKVLETIRSRSIILQFKPIPHDILKNYLIKIVSAEEIIIQEEAIELIIELSEQSVRDSLNIIDRLRIIDNTISKEMILQEYGSPEKKTIYALFYALLNENTTSYYAEKKNIIIGHYGQKKFFEIAVLFIQELLEKYYLKNEKSYSLAQLNSYLLKLYKYEELFLTSNNPLGILDLFLVNNDKRETNKEDIKLSSGLIEKTDSIIFKKAGTEKDNAIQKISNGQGGLIEEFISHLDSALISILKQGKIEIIDEKNKIEILFKKNFSFYKDFLFTKKNFIEQAMQKTFHKIYLIEYLFTLESNQKSLKEEPAINDKAMIKTPVVFEPIIEKEKNAPSNNKKTYTKYEKKNKKIISPEYTPELLKKIIEILPGITYIKEENYEY